MTSRIEPRTAHGKARELAEILQRGGHLPPMSDDELAAVLWNLFGEDPPESDGVGRLLLALFRAGFSNPEDHGVIVEEFRDYSWFSAFNAALRPDEPFRFLRIEDDDIHAYVLRGPRVHELEDLVEYGVDHGAAEVPESDERGLVYHDVDDGARAAELAAIEARLVAQGYELESRLGDPEEPERSRGYLDDLYGFNELAAYVDVELVACGSSRRVYYLGEWKPGHIMLFLIIAPAIADELIAAGYGLGAPGDWHGAPSIKFRASYPQPDPDRPVTKWPA